MTTVALPVRATSALADSDGAVLKYTYLAGNDALVDASDGSVILQFWASWCRSCAGVARDLAGLALQEPTVRHLAISTDESLDAAQSVAQAMSAYASGKAAVLHDSNAEWAKHYRVVTVPTVVILDRAGNEAGRFVGHLNSADLSDIASLLSGSTLQAPRQAAR